MYFIYLDDPGSLVDASEVARLEAALQAATDPLEKVQAIARLQRAQVVDEEECRSGFVTNAKRWADANDVPVSAFRAMGVSENVLRDAGFEAEPRSTEVTRKARNSSKRPTITAKQIKVALAKRKAQFTLADVAQMCGGSPMTIRKAVDELIREGLVTRIGPTPDWKQQGRAPILFETRHRESSPSR